MSEKSFRPSSIVICSFLVIANLVVYFQVLDHEFVNYADYEYIVDNNAIKAGLSIKSIIWAFTTFHSSNWHPLTWLSHMLDYQIYGLNPMGHHLTNLLFHIANSLLLFLIFKRMTNARWCSAIVAALFAIHPLHIESVAWISERKDVLSAFFWFLTIWYYIQYVDNLKFNYFIIALLSFVLGLMCKPMLVTLPFVLLLLDYWPLGRLLGCGPGHAVVLKRIEEKVPFLILAVVSCVITFIAQQKGGTEVSIEYLSIKSRVFNAMYTYVNYILTMIWPGKIAVLKLHPAGLLSLWHTAGNFFLLTCVTVIVFIVRKYPYLVVGWLWYLGTLVPVIGLVQVGPPTLAERYTYIPLIGIFVMISWGISDLTGRRDYTKKLTAISVGILLLSLIVYSRSQVRHWQNSVALFENAIKKTPNNANDIAEKYLANTLSRRGKLNEALIHYNRAIKINPSYPDAYYRVGLVMSKQGKLNEAILNYKKALKFDPYHSKAGNSLGIALARQGNINEAVLRWRETLKKDPDNVSAQKNLNLALSRYRDIIK